MVVFCIFFFGGAVIHDFAFTLLLGVLVGTYSSVFVASPVVYLWHKGKAPR
jgi:preprotein translocase subunit SecF